MSKFHLLLILTCFTSAVHATSSLELEKLSDNDFYNLYGSKSVNLIADHSDAKLKEQPDIEAYAFDCHANNDIKLLVEFARRRVKDKQDIYPTMNDEDILFLNSNDQFLEDFTEFLKSFNATNFFTSIEARAVEVSRGTPDENYPKGQPLIDSNIRKKNREFAKKIADKHDAMYASLNNYMKTITETHNYSIAYIKRQD